MSVLVKVDTSRLVKKLRDLGKDGDRMAKAVIQSEAENAVSQIKKNAPADLGKLRQNTGKDSLDGGLIAAIFVNVPYAAYVEFGTGRYVDVPSELADLANKFKGGGNGSFEDFKLAITDWARRKGIEDRFVYAIILQILNNGIHPQPYFYPAYQKLRVDLPKKLKLGFTKIANAKSR